MSVPVTFTDGVSSTISVFALFHNAFLSATPLPGKSVTGDITGISKRNLKDFADKYARAMNKAKQLHDPNVFKDVAVSSGFTTPGASLLAFSEVWYKVLQALGKSELPTAKDQKTIREDFVKLEDARIKSQSAVITKVVEMTKRDYYKRYPGLKDRESLQGIIERMKKPDRERQFGSSYDRVQEHHLEGISDESIASKIQNAFEYVKNIKTRLLDPETATWADLVKIDAEVLYQDSSIPSLVHPDEYPQQAQTATALLTSVEQLYSGTTLANALMKFLAESAAPFADKAAEDLTTKFGASLDERDHAEVLKKYSVGLRSLAGELQNFSNSFANKTTPQTSFELQFQSVKTINDLGTKLSTAGRTTVPPGWTKQPLVPFSASAGSYVTGTTGSGTGSGSTGSAGSAGRTGGGWGGGSTGGALWRVLDKERLKDCTELAKKFASSIDDTDRKTVERQAAITTENLGMIERSVSDLVASNQEDNATKLDGLRNQQSRFVKAFLVRAHGVMTRHRDRHVMFALRFNRGPMKYMLYWRDSGDPSAKGVTNDYFEKLKEAITKGGVEIDAMVTSVESLLRGPKTYTGLTDTDIEAIIDKFEQLRAFKQSCKDRITAVHTRPSTFLDQLMSDSHVHIIYVLKGLRFALALMSMSIATKAFTSVYASNVYVKNVDPPPPTLFLAMFFAVNLAMNAGVYTVLWASNRVFKSPSNDFPIDSYLLTAWAADVALSELAMMGISFAFANIIATKKAFRYRQEGDRGIRALGQMMLYSYAVLLCIPFFRIA